MSVVASPPTDAEQFWIDHQEYIIALLSQGKAALEIMHLVRWPYYHAKFYDLLRSKNIDTSCAARNFRRHEYFLHMGKRRLEDKGEDEGYQDPEISIGKSMPDLDHGQCGSMDPNRLEFVNTQYMTGPRLAPDLSDEDFSQSVCQSYPASEVPPLIPKRNPRRLDPRIRGTEQSPFVRSRQIQGFNSEFLREQTVLATTRTTDVFPFKRSYSETFDFADRSNWGVSDARRYTADAILSQPNVLYLMNTEPKLSIPHPVVDYTAMYKVACPVDHQGFHVDLAASDCGYKHIHDLCLHAWFWEPNKFAEELDKVEEVNSQMLHQVDGVGNSALHYAAIGKASLEHTTLLLQRRVNIFQRNTAGQLFLHLLDPHIIVIQLLLCSSAFAGFSKSQIGDLLAIQDYDGMSVVHSIASRVQSRQCGIDFYKFVLWAGYPIDLRDCWNRNANDILISNVNNLDAWPADSTWSNIIPDGIRTNVLTPISTSDTSIVAKGSNVSIYLHPSARNNIMHLLSVVTDRSRRLSGLKTYLQSLGEERAIEYLTAYNANGETPILFSIFQRPADEHGVNTVEWLEQLKLALGSNRFQHEVQMRNRAGETAFYGACVSGLDHVAKMLIGASNVNARARNGVSVLRATCEAQERAIADGNVALMKSFEEIITMLADQFHAVLEPSSAQERGLRDVAVEITGWASGADGM